MHGITCCLNRIAQKTFLYKAVACFFFFFLSPGEYEIFITSGTCCNKSYLLYKYLC